MTDVLKTVTDRFCLYSNARKGRQNGRQYVLSAVKAMLESKETQEGLRLGELFGYYGHGRRQLTGKLEVPESGPAPSMSGDHVSRVQPARLLNTPLSVVLVPPVLSS